MVVTACESLLQEDVGPCIYLPCGRNFPCVLASLNDQAELYSLFWFLFVKREWQLPTP